MSRKERREIRVPALEVRQGPKRSLYAFSIDGKAIPKFARLVHLKRDASGGVIGYQRPEAMSHIEEIRRFLDTPDPMLPNAIVLAFDKSVRFITAVRSFKQPSYSRTGVLVIPYWDDCPEEEKPASVVDGQQRLAAVRDSRLHSFPLCVTAFVADDIAEQTSQFILVNSTKPVSKGLIYELLPATKVRLPRFLERRKIPAALLHTLNSEASSPFYGRIKTPTNPTGIIQDNSVLQMLEHSLNEGALYTCRRSDTVNFRRAFRILSAFWGAAADIFGSDWDLPPRHSRLTHGVGIIGLGLLMDTIAGSARSRRDQESKQFYANNLRPLAKHCHWTSGSWELADGSRVHWEVENTHGGIKIIADHLRGLHDMVVKRARRSNNQ